jgi:hypothetical protein
MPVATAEKITLPQRGSAAAIGEIIKLGKRISINEMNTIAETAEIAGGTLVACDPDGDWCGTGQLHFKWPVPKKEEFLKFMDTLVAMRINWEVLINGVPVPRDIMINVSRQISQWQAK